MAPLCPPPPLSYASAPEHHHFKVFAAPETIIFKTSFLQAVPSPPAAGLLRPAQTQSVWPAPRGYSRPECQPDASYKLAPEAPISSSSPLQSPAFSRSSRSRAPDFSLCRGTYLLRCGQVPRPPDQNASNKSSRSLRGHLKPYIVRPNKRKPVFISGISSLPLKI